MRTSCHCSSIVCMIIHVLLYQYRNIECSTLISQILRKAIKIGTRQVGHLEQWAQEIVQKGTNRETGMTTRMKFDGISQAIHALHAALCSDQCDFWHPPSQYLAFSQPLHFLSAALGLPHHEHLYNATVFGLTRGCEHLCG